jgi:hypothetical protein
LAIALMAAAGCKQRTVYRFVCPKCEPYDSGSSGGTGGVGGAGGTAGSGGAGGSGGVPLDPVQACIDFYETHKIFCSPLTDYSEDYCLNRIADIGSECADDAAAAYACWVSELIAAQACETNKTPECAMLTLAFDACHPKDCEPLGGPPMCIVYDSSFPSCECHKVCGDSKFTVRCTQDATMRNCDCLIDDALAGTCQEPAGPFCEARYGCCNQYFNLPQWPK